MSWFKQAGLWLGKSGVAEKVLVETTAETAGVGLGGFLHDLGKTVGVFYTFDAMPAMALLTTSSTYPASH